MDKFSKLSRDEMKHVLGGKDPINDGCPDTCQTDAQCQAGETCTIGTGALGCESQLNCV